MSPALTRSIPRMATGRFASTCLINCHVFEPATSLTLILFLALAPRSYHYSDIFVFPRIVLVLPYS